ncbi:MAG: site-specific DNA-methyltransferase [Muribaculaceae bacterium]|nr:site-specific DNA-methyltransferase [Muribaculaceae bacterium]
MKPETFGKITLYNGDCLEVLPMLADASIDAIICDLPYAVLNKSNPSAKWDKEIDMQKMWEQIWRVLKPNGACVLFGQGLFSAKLMMSQPKLYRYSLVWDKINRATGFLDAKRKPLRIHEDILVFYRKLPTYNPQMTYGDVCHKRGKAGKSRCYGSYKSTPTIITNEKYPTSIVRVSKEHKNFYHPTCKPVALLEWLIKTYSNEGDTILDFTMGSGSTMVACVNTKRKGIAIELMQEYYDIAVKRVKEVLDKPKTFFD